MTNYGQSKPIHKLVCPCLPISQWLAFFAQIFPGNPQNDSNCPNFFVFDLFAPCWFYTLLWNQLSDLLKRALRWEVDNRMNFKFQIGLVCSLHCKYIQKTCIASWLGIPSQNQKYVLRWVRWVRLCLCQSVSLLKIWEQVYASQVVLPAHMESKFEEYVELLGGLARGVCWAAGGLG